MWRFSLGYAGSLIEEKGGETSKRYLRGKLMESVLLQVICALPHQVRLRTRDDLG